MSNAGDEVVEPVGEEGVDDLNGAVQMVLKKALMNDGLVRGLHECAKVLDAGKAHVCFLSENCDEEAYKKLVYALAKDRKIPVIEVEESKTLGEWAGLRKIDKDGKSRKIVGASCVCVTDYGEESPGLHYLQKHCKQYQQLAS
eukprot:Platyproteum_vivax@DN429_c0_g1_i1.p1